MNIRDVLAMNPLPRQLVVTDMADLSLNYPAITFGFEDSCTDRMEIRVSLTRIWVDTYREYEGENTSGIDVPITVWRFLLVVMETLIAEKEKVAA